MKSRFLSLPILAGLPVWTAIGTLFALSACATSEQAPPSRSQQPSSVAAVLRRHPVVTSSSLTESPLLNQTPATGTPDQTEYNEIHQLYSNQSYDQALDRMKGFETRYPSSPLISQVENLRGLSLLLTHHADLAIAEFKNALAHEPANSGFKPYLTYNLSRAQFEAGDIDGSETTASTIDLSKLDPDNRLKFHFLKASILNRRGFNYEASQELLTASREVKPMTPELQKVFVSSLNVSLTAISGISQLEDLYHQFGDSPLVDTVLYQLGSKEYALGLAGKAEKHLKTLIDQYPDSQYASQAQTLLTNSSNQPIDRKAIGVLLPLNGKFGGFGQRNLQAIELAFHIFDSGTPDPGYELVVEDSGSEPDQAVQALNRLVMKDHVAAVIGPLLSKGIDQVTRRAAELGVPLISLARHVGAKDNYVVQAGMTLKMQAREIARYAIQNRGLRRFAILYPQDQVGEDSAQYFWDAVKEFGGQIVGIESYQPDETDFRVQVEKLSGLYYTHARQDELDELARKRRRDHVTRKTRKNAQYWDLPPIVDYDAVFIPDGPKVTGQIMPTFAYCDVDHVQFLGTSAWNSMDLINRAQQYAEGSLFVDAFFSGSQAPRVRKFIDDYHAEFGMAPNALDAIAYDGALVLKKALKDVGSSFSRSDLIDRIREIQNLNGVTGNITFKDEQLSRNLRVLSIQGGQIVQEKD